MDKFDLSLKLNEIGLNAKKAQSHIAFSKHSIRNNALLNTAVNLRKNIKEIISINKKDVLNAKQNKLKDSFIDRLFLDA